MDGELIRVSSVQWGFLNSNAYINLWLMSQIHLKNEFREIHICVWESDQSFHHPFRSNATIFPTNWSTLCYLGNENEQSLSDGSAGNDIFSRLTDQLELLLAIESIEYVNLSKEFIFDLHILTAFNRLRSNWTVFFFISIFFCLWSIGNKCCSANVYSGC